MQNKQDLIELGSKTAKNGFRNEDDIISKFNNWKSDKDAKQWLLLMNYKLEEITLVKAVKIAGEKTDVQVQIRITLKEAINVENLQVKLVSNKKGFNQIDKRWLKNYNLLWDIPENIYEILQHYTGEKPPCIKTSKDKRRMFMNEFTQDKQLEVINFVEQHKTMIISDILKGRGRFAAEWMLVVQKSSTDFRWVLKPMNFVLNFYTGEVIITPRGCIKIGKITMQRKGGDNGRPTANMLQFKIDPAELFNS